MAEPCLNIKKKKKIWGKQHLFENVSREAEVWQSCIYNYKYNTKYDNMQCWGTVSITDNSSPLTN